MEAILLLLSILLLLPAALGLGLSVLAAAHGWNSYAITALLSSWWVASLAFMLPFFPQTTAVLLAPTLVLCSVSPVLVMLHERRSLKGAAADTLASLSAKVVRLYETSKSDRHLPYDARYERAWELHRRANELLKKDPRGALLDAEQGSRLADQLLQEHRQAQ